MQMLTTYFRKRSPWRSSYNRIKPTNSHMLFALEVKFFRRCVLKSEVELATVQRDAGDQLRG